MAIEIDVALMLHCCICYIIMKYPTGPSSLDFFNIGDTKLYKTNVYELSLMVAEVGR